MSEIAIAKRQLPSGQVEPAAEAVPGDADGAHRVNANGAGNGNGNGAGAMGGLNPPPNRPAPGIGEGAAGLSALRKRDRALITATLTCWSVFFMLGATVSTAALRKDLWSGPVVSTGLTRVSNMALVFFCYTLTNVFFLSLCASVLGGAARRWSIVSRLDPSEIEIRRAPAHIHNWTAILRGFVLYLLVISGALVVGGEQAMSEPTPMQYVKLAGVVSLAAFFVGYDPQWVFDFGRRFTGGGGAVPR